MGKECRTCVFNTKKESCKVLNKRIEKDCWAWADMQEYERRKADMDAYKARYMVGKECNTCVFNTKQKSCKVLNERILKNCFAWADEAEYARRKADIEAYKARYEVDISKFSTIKERLNDSFMELYEKNLNDTEIAKTLKLNPNTVGNYRRKLGLENNYRKKAHANGQIKK